MNTKLHDLVLFASLAIVPGMISAQRPTSIEAPADQALKKAVPTNADGSAPFVAYRGQDGRVHADGGRYRVDFATSGIDLSTPPVTEGGVEPTLHLRLLGSRRGANYARADRSVEPSLTGHFIRYQRDGFVETYEVEAGGYEQSFHLAAPPAGVGDLVFEIAADGNVTADPTKTTCQQALEFRHDGSAAIRYGEAWAFDRGGERCAVATRYDGAGRIELVVPSAFLDRATYPVVVDPAVGPVLNPGGTAYADSAPDVAYNGDAGHYMVVWQRSFTPTIQHIRGQIYDAAREPVGGTIAITNTGNNQNPSIAPCRHHNSHLGEDLTFVVVYELVDPSTTKIMGQLRSADVGTKLLEFPATAPITGVRNQNPDVAGVWGDGSASHEAPVLVAYEVVLPTQTQPTFIDLSNLDVLAYPNSGWRKTQTAETVSVSSGFVSRPRLAQSDAQWVGTSTFMNRLVWNRFYNSPAPGDYDVRTAYVFSRLGYSSTIGAPESVQGAASIGVHEKDPDIAALAFWPGSQILHPFDMQYCIAWEEDGDIKAHMYNHQYPIYSEFTVRADPNVTEFMPAVGAGFDEFTVVYGERPIQGGGQTNIYGARVKTNAWVPVDHRPIDVLNGPSQSGLCVSSRTICPEDGPIEPTNGALVAWSGYTSPTSDIRARGWEPVEPVVIPFGVPCPGPLGEMPRIGTDNGPPVAGRRSFELTVSDAPASSVAILFISDTFASTPIPGAPGCNLYLGLPVIGTYVAVTSPSGTASAPVPIPTQIPTGTNLAFQWIIYSPTANAFGWIVSDDLDISWYQ